MEEKDWFLLKNKYGSYAVPETCREKGPIRKALRNGYIHEAATIEYLKKHRGRGAIIQAGAWYGDFLPALGATGNKIFSFEPTKLFYECALLTIEMNFKAGEHNIELFNYGIGDKVEEKDILLRDNEGSEIGGAALYDFDRPDRMKMLDKLYKFDKDNMNSNQTETTKITTLDNIIPEKWKRNVSIIQLDIEGYEEKALMGGLTIIEQSLPMIIIEEWDFMGQDILNTPFYKEEIFGRGYKEVDRFERNIVLVKE